VPVIKFDRLDAGKFFVSFFIILLLFGITLYHLQIGVQKVQPNRIVMICPNLYINEESVFEIKILDGHGKFITSRKDTIDISVQAQEEYLIGVNDKSEIKWAKMHRIELKDGVSKIRFRASAGANMGMIIFTFEQVNGETPLQKVTFIKNVGFKYGETFFLD
jgi:hypothetical protein